MDFLSISITEQSVIAVAEHRRRRCPVRQPSPKKAPSFRMPMVASFPTFETTVSFTFPSFDLQHAQLFASSSQSGQSLGLSSHEPCPRRPIASQESSETAGCAEQAGYPPCRRSPTGTDKIDCHVDRRWFLADRRGCRATLGKNSPGPHRCRRAIL